MLRSGEREEDPLLSIDGAEELSQEGKQAGKARCLHLQHVRGESLERAAWAR